MAKTNFDLGAWHLKRVDGSGEEVVIQRTPASLIRARGVDDQVLAIYVSAYHSAVSCGRMGDLDVDLKGCKDDEARAMRIADRYSVWYEPLDDDGNPLEDGDGEPDPT